MELSALRPDKEGYLVDPETGAPAVFYCCDPRKNVICDHSMCRYPEERADDSEVGFCVSTPVAAFRREGTGPFCFRLDGHGQYREVPVKEGDHDQG